MGQQQLLLIILAIIVVAVAVALSIVLFQQASVDHKRDLVVNECQNLATLALSYSKKAETLGGGGNSFTGWQLPDGLKNTPNGNYTANIQSDKIVIIGTGNELVNGTDSIKVETTVSENSYSTKILN